MLFINHLKLSKMKFQDNITRGSLDTVFVIRTENEMRQREEYNSNLWELVKNNGKNNIYSIPVRDVKIGESLFDAKGKYVTYRVS